MLANGVEVGSAYGRDGASGGTGGVPLRINPTDWTDEQFSHLEHTDIKFSEFEVAEVVIWDRGRLC